MCFDTASGLARVESLEGAPPAPTSYDSTPAAFWRAGRAAGLVAAAALECSDLVQMMPIIRPTKAPVLIEKKAPPKIEVQTKNTIIDIEKPSIRLLETRSPLAM